MSELLSPRAVSASEERAPIATTVAAGWEEGAALMAGWQEQVEEVVTPRMAAAPSYSLELLLG